MSLPRPAASAGSGVWKWLDLSGIAGLVFTVPADALTQTFDLGGRENGFDIDKLVFAPDGSTYTVDDLMQVAVGTPAGPTMHVLEAEGGQYGAETRADRRCAGVFDRIDDQRHQPGNVGAGGAVFARFCRARGLPALRPGKGGARAARATTACLLARVSGPKIRRSRPTGAC